MPSRPRIRQSANSNPRATASHSWRASLIRKRAQVLGDVQAVSREAAEAAAVRTFNLTAEQRTRLVVQERG
jgi:transposase